MHIFTNFPFLFFAQTEFARSRSKASTSWYGSADVDIVVLNDGDNDNDNDNDNDIVSTSLLTMHKEDAEMKRLVDEARDQPSSRIVGLYDQIKALGSRLNLLYRRRFFPGQIGVHRFNRETEMISGLHSMQIWNDIDNMGFCEDLVKDATAFEEPPSRIN